MEHSIPLVLVVELQCLDIDVKTVCQGLCGAKHVWSKGTTSRLCTLSRCITFDISTHTLIGNGAIQMWNGLFFQHTTLRDLGLRVQLGHAYGRSCPTRLAANATFRVIHSNGIHHVAIDQCRCHGVDLNKQLLCIGWWPATPLDPKSATTFDVLRHFHLLNLQGKVTGYSFYRALEFQTDNTGLEPPPVCPFNNCSNMH